MKPAKAARPASAAVPALPEFEALDRTHREAMQMLQAFGRLLDHLDDKGLDDVARAVRSDLVVDARGDFEFGEDAEARFDFAGQLRHTQLQRLADGLVLIDLEDSGADLVDGGVKFVEHVVDPTAHVVIEYRRERDLQGEADAEEALDDRIVQVTRETFAFFAERQFAHAGAQHLLIDNQAGRATEGFDEVLRLLAERLAVERFGQVEVAVDVTVTGRDRHAKKSLHGRVVRGEARRPRVRPQVVNS